MTENPEIAGPRRLPGVAARLQANVAARRGARPSPIIPASGVTSRALMAVIAIMTFLASLTLGGVWIVAGTAQAWQADISREATIRIMPEPGLDMQAATSELQILALSTPGVQAALPVEDADVAAML